MAIVMILIFLLIVLTAVFIKVAEWFQEIININIMPAALIETIAGVIFMFHYGSAKTKDIIWVCVVIAIVLVIVVFNLIKYGFRDGALTSLTELVFGISASFLIVCFIITSSQKGKRKRKK